jgi:hypothetical protein
MAMTVIAVPLVRGGMLTVTQCAEVGAIHVTAHGWICSPRRARSIMLLAAMAGCKYMVAETENNAVKGLLDLLGFVQDDNGVWWIRLKKTGDLCKDDSRKEA